ncbi:MAG: HNH endonuclease [Clostridia bacterium]|nr:HNH endonuclease [Clostridia bacterium]
MGIKVRTEDYTEGDKRRKSNSAYEKETAEEKSPWKRSYSDVFNVPVTVKSNKTSNSDETKKEQDITYIPSEKGFEEKYAGKSYAELGNEAATITADYLTGVRSDIDYDEINWLNEMSKLNAPEEVKQYHAEKEKELARNQEEKRKARLEKRYGTSTPTTEDIVSQATAIKSHETDADVGGYLYRAIKDEVITAEEADDTYKNLTGSEGGLADDSTKNYVKSFYSKGTSGVSDEERKAKLIELKKATPYEDLYDAETEANYEKKYKNKTYQQNNDAANDVYAKYVESGFDPKYRQEYDWLVHKAEELRPYELDEEFAEFYTEKVVNDDGYSEYNDAKLFLDAYSGLPERAEYWSEAEKEENGWHLEKYNSSKEIVENYSGNLQKYSSRIKELEENAYYKKELEEIEKEIEKHKNKKYDGIFATIYLNYLVSDLNIEKNKKGNDYAKSGKAYEFALAAKYDELIGNIVSNNEEQMEGSNALEELLASGASYLPQGIEQAKTALPYMIVGVALTGSLSGIKAGYVAGSMQFSYEQTMGSTIYELTEMGLSFEDAKRLANNSAFASSMIEGIDSVIDVITWGRGKIGKITLEGAKKIATPVIKKLGLKNIVKLGLNKLVKSKGNEMLLKLGLSKTAVKVINGIAGLGESMLKDMAGEFGEEFMQSGIQEKVINHAENILAGNENSEDLTAFDLFLDAFDFGSYENDELANMTAAGIEGAKTSLALGLGRAGASMTIQSVSSALSKTKIGSIITEGGKTNELIEYAKSMPKETETRQKVNKLVEKAESGKKVTNADVGELAVTMFEEGTIDAESYNWLLGMTETKTVQQTSPEEAETTYSDNINGKSEVQEQVETTGKKLQYADILEEVRRNGTGSVENIYTGVLSKLSDTKVLGELLSMSKTERAFASAGAKGYDITTAVNMAKEVSLKGGREVEALEYGLSLRGKGYGEEVEILADIIEYGEANPDSEVNALLSEFAEETAVDKTVNKEYTKEQRDADIQAFVKGEKAFEEVLDAYTYLYAELVNSNKVWKWRKAIPGYGNISKKQRRQIKERAQSVGLIPKVDIKISSDSKRGYADFSSSNLVKIRYKLPENMWKWNDRRQFAWLNEQIGGKIPGYTWHHSETPGEMELVPTGIHRITPHLGGRSPGMWAYIGKSRNGGRKNGN